MDYEAFVAACREQWDDFDDAEALARAPHPRDRSLLELPERVDGFATENKLMLLNRAVAAMEPDEVYVEVGSWRGLSLLGAAAGNEDRTLFACDDFSKFGCTSEALETNVARYGDPGHIEIHESDYRPFLRRAPWRPRRVGVFFYDGPHDFHHQYHALELILPSLAEDALVVIDDTCDRPVRAANDLFVRTTPGLEPVLDLESPRYPDPAWWNGLQVFRWRGDPDDREPPSAAELLARRLIWNRFVVYAQRAASYVASGSRRIARS